MSRSEARLRRLTLPITRRKNLDRYTECLSAVGVHGYY